MKPAEIPQLRDAPLASKLELVEELWAEITAKAESLPLPDWQVHELDESLRDYEANPREGKHWPEIRDGLLGNK